MPEAYILIENGVVVFSPELLQEFPEITATITGNVITVSNVWREDLISVIGDNIFFTENAEFASFSIIFTDNKASVANIDNLIVRYVNFHDGDYQIDTPKYLSTVNLITDPLNLGVKPNYYGILGQYAEGSVTIDELAKAVASMYREATQKSVDDEIIAQIVGNISLDDIVTYLGSQLSAMDTYNTVKDNLSLDLNGSGEKTYALTTASKELELVEQGGDIEITKLCVSDGEDVSELIPNLLENATVISQCVLKMITPTQFAQGVFTKITTYFGVHIDIERTPSLNSIASAKIYYDNDDVVTELDYEYPISPSLLGELLADLIEKSSVLQITYFAIYGRKYFSKGMEIYYPILASYDTFYDGRWEVFERWHGNNCFSIAKEILDGKSIPMRIDVIGCKRVLPSNLLTGVKYGASGRHPEQFFDVPSIVWIGGRTQLAKPLFDDGVFSVMSALDFGFMGTLLQSKVTQIIIRNQLEESTLMAQAIRLGFTDVKSGIQNFGCLGGIGFGFELKNYKQEIVNIIDAGLNQFDRLSPVSELEVSRRGIDISVANITHGNLLICPFGEATQGSGYFESGVETPYLIEDIIGSTNYQVVNLGRYEFAMSSITLNDVSIADKTQILEVLVGEQPITVACNYSLRSQDIALFTSIFESLRKGYKEVFRFGSTSDIIEVTEDYFSYSVLSKFYDVLIGGIEFNGTTTGDIMTSHHNLVSIAQGGSVSVSSVFDDMKMLGDMQFIKDLDTSNIEFNISLNGITKVPCTISTLNSTADTGYLTLTSHEEDLIDFAYGDAQNAFNNATPTDPDNFYIMVLLHHTLEDDKLVLYYLKIGKSQGDVFGSLIHIAINIKTTNATFGAVEAPQDSPQIPTSWGTIATVPTESSNVTSDGNYVHYTFADNGDGSVTVSYTAFDKDGNDITDQFNTLSIGDYFLHKEVE